MRSRAKAAGVSVLPREKGTKDTKDWKAILTKLKGKKPDAILYEPRYNRLITANGRTGVNISSGTGIEVAGIEFISFPEMKRR